MTLRLLTKEWIVILIRLPSVTRDRSSRQWKVLKMDLKPLIIIKKCVHEAAYFISLAKYINPPERAILHNFKKTHS